MCNLCYLLNIIRRGWEYNSNVDLREKIHETVGWFYMAEERVY
jgi:hypothetical protein